MIVWICRSAHIKRVQLTHNYLAIASLLLHPRCWRTCSFFRVQSVAVVVTHIIIIGAIEWIRMHKRGGLWMWGQRITCNPIVGIAVSGTIGILRRSIACCLIFEIRWYLQARKGNRGILYEDLRRILQVIIMHRIVWTAIFRVLWRRTISFTDCLWWHWRLWLGLVILRMVFDVMMTVRIVTQTMTILREGLLWWVFREASGCSEERLVIIYRIAWCG